MKACQISSITCAITAGYWTKPQSRPTFEIRPAHPIEPVVRKNSIRRFSTQCNMFYKRECQEKKLPPRLGAEKFFLTSSPCIDMRIRDFPDSPNSSFWRNDVHRFLIATLDDGPANALIALRELLCCWHFRLRGFHGPETIYRLD